MDPSVTITPNERTDYKLHFQLYLLKLFCLFAAYPPMDLWKVTKKLPFFGRMVVAMGRFPDPAVLLTRAWGRLWTTGEYAEWGHGYEP